jgi:organic hydroperoxide reductase OsmC/OhrA
VAVDAARAATSGLGGDSLPRAEEWWPEHLLLASLVRCTLASLDFHAKQADVEATGSGRAHGLVTKRDDDGLYAFVEIDATFVIDFDPAVGQDVARELIANAERGCFVGNSLTARPRYRWIVDGEEIA